MTSFDGTINIRMTDGFWKQKQELNRKETIWSVYQRLLESGRVDALACRSDSEIEPHFFWDSDVAKWIEAVAYLIEEKAEPELERLADAMIESIASAQDADGYYNCFYLPRPKEERFRIRSRHELYCAGHLIEAAIAYKHATGKDLLYRCMLRYADLIDRVFRIEKSAGFLTPGHQEIELALLKLWKESGEERYLLLSEYFLNTRGLEEERLMVKLKEDRFDYAQDRYPVREQTEAAGHAVRLLYMAIAMAELAQIRQDEELKAACERIFFDIASKKLYITGGLGSNPNIEGFDEGYHLPNDTAYNETCASIALCMFAQKMLNHSEDSSYADVIELALYNGVLSGLSLDGRSFFYENPLEIELASPERLFGDKTHIHYPSFRREPWLSCSCCPTNLVRFIPRVGEMIASIDDNRIRVHQYMNSEIMSGSVRMVQKTDYPKNGTVDFLYEGPVCMVGFRVPAWCTSWNILHNGQDKEGKYQDGYYWLQLETGDKVQLDFDMPVTFVEANPRVRANAGRVAVIRGPIVYCAEQCNNPDVRLFDFRVDAGVSPKIESPDSSGLSQITVFGTVRDRNSSLLYSVTGIARESAELHLIPYYSFANRELCDMMVWLLK